MHRASKTTRDQAARSIAALDKVNRHPVGVILNMITRSASKYSYEYAYYYAAYRPNRGDGKGAHHQDNSDNTTAATTTADSGTEVSHPDDAAASPFDGAAGSPRKSGRA